MSSQDAVLPMTCPPPKSTAHAGELVNPLLLLHIELLACWVSFAALPFPSGLNAPQDGAVAPAPFSNSRGAVMIIVKFAHSHSPMENVSKGSESGTQRAVNIFRDSLERLS